MLQNLVKLEACSLLLYIRSLVLGKANIQSSSLSLTLALELEPRWPCVILGKGAALRLGCCSLSQNSGSIFEMKSQDTIQLGPCLQVSCPWDIILDYSWPPTFS